MKKWQIAVLVLVVAVAAAGIGAYAATNYGTQSDPLIAQSYLDEVLGPQIERSIDEKLAQATGQSAGGGFTVVELAAGESLELAAGSELVPRAGTVTASASLADVTSGAETAAGAALEQNHLYAASATCRLYAEGSVTLLLRGSFNRS